MSSAVTQPANNDEIPPHDGPRPVRELLQLALVQAVGQYRVRKGVPALVFTDSLREACSVAKHQHLRAEHLLVILKQSWQRLPEAQALSPRDAERALNDVVALCIEEYYRMDATP